MKNFVADRMKNVRESVIRNISEAAAKRPSIISLANGNPSAEIFPAKKLASIAQKVLSENPVMAHYGFTLGYPALREALKGRLASKYKIDFTRNELAIVSGGTQGCDIISRIFINEGDAIITEEPSYGSFFNDFHAYGAKLIGVPVGEKGIDVDRVEFELKSNRNVKMIYTIPTFANPTGFTASMETREALYSLAHKYDVLIFEDDPYGELRYKGVPVSPIKSMDTDGRVLYLGSLSKTISPSFRLGYVVFDKAYEPVLNIAKQISEAGSNAPLQYVAAEYINSRDYDDHIAECCETYGRKGTLMMNNIREKMHPSIKTSSPEGGFFVMMFLPEGHSGVKFVWDAMDRGVACVPGSGFMIDQEAPNRMVRLCYSTPTDDEINRGMAILGQLSHEVLDK